METAPSFTGLSERRSRLFACRFLPFMHLGNPKMHVGSVSLFICFAPVYDALVRNRKTKRKEKI